MKKYSTITVQVIRTTYDYQLVTIKVPANDKQAKISALLVAQSKPENFCDGYIGKYEAQIIERGHYV